MRETREISIEELRPTDREVFIEGLLKYKRDPAWIQKKKNEHPEVWNIDGEILIAEGHHRLFERYQGINEYIIVAYNTLSQNVPLSTVEYNVREILREKRAQTRNAHINHIWEMRVA